MMSRMFLPALLLVVLPIAAEPVPGARSWRVTLVMLGGEDSAAVAKRLAAMYRGELVTPVDENGSFLIALTDAAAALVEDDPSVESVQADPAVAVPSPPAAVAVRTPQVVVHGSTSWSLGTYSYDGTGNIKKVGTDVYVYDTNNRLVSGTAGGKSEKYTYDEFGNILAIETSGSPRRLLGVDPASNRMDQTTGVFAGQSVTYDMTAGYDANGNVTSYLLDRFEYDGANVLRKAHVAGKWRSYVYNASDERIAVIERSSETGGETRSDWTFRDASGQVLRRLSRVAGQWQWNQDYIYRDGQMLASEVGAPAKRYHYHLDHLGTPRLITGNGGVEISRHTYLPFGVEVGATPGHNPADGEWKKFTGHERDQGSIDYMHARYYNPFMGRFLSVDPTRASVRPAQPQTWNRYAYARNNPILRIDPDGLVDRRTTDDKQITESAAALRVAAVLNRQRKVEYGATILVQRTASGSRYVAAGPRTDNRADKVDVLLPPPGTKNLTAVATMHNHVAHGTYQVPSRTDESKTEAWSPTSPTKPSGADAAAANQTGVTGYITVPSEGVLVKVNADCTSEVILSDDDYDAWATRAREYVNAPVEQTPP